MQPSAYFVACLKQKPLEEIFALKSCLSFLAKSILTFPKYVK